MYNELCHYGNTQFLGSFGDWGSIDLILNVIFWVGLIAILTLLIVWAVRRARVRAPAVQYATGQQTADETVQAQYARGEITREQYQLMKQVIGKKQSIGI